MRMMIVLLSPLILSNCAPTCDISKLVKGVTSENEIRNLCGDPSTINASSYNKQWVYRTGMIESVYIYTEDGKFKSAQWTEK